MTASAGTQRRVALLTAQAFALGLSLAWVTIPATAIFLETFGSGLLPVTYICAALAGAVASVLLGRAFRARPLASVAVRLLATVCAVLTTSWLVVWLTGTTWLSFPLLVMLPIALPIGFVFVVGQAGMLLDVRAMKALYPRVIAGFAMGFTFGGLAGAPLLGVLGGTEHLLAAAAATSIVLLALVALTRRSFPAELSGVESQNEDLERVTLRSLLSNRFVMMIVGFQMLSAIESQLLDFLVYDRAAARYSDGEQLAAFVGRFSAIAYGTDIAFLLLGAGWLMRRFGLRYGLNANPVVVGAMVIAVLTASAVQGSSATVVFVLIVATRVIDMALADGSTRTAVGAVYQAVPTPQRLAAQANVESLAVPMAIGLSGVVILAVDATVGTDGPALAILTVGVLLLWVVFAAFIYGDYRVNLLANLRHRQLEPAEMTISGAHARPVIERLLSSSDPRDVRLGIAALVAADPSDLIDRLARLVGEVGGDLHPHVLGHLADVDPVRAATAARRSIEHRDGSVRAAGLTALAALGQPEDAREAIGLLGDPDAEVRLAAALVVANLGDAETTTLLARTFVDAVHGASNADRRLAALMLGSCKQGPWMNRSLLAGLLGDPDPAVAIAAADAFRWPEDRELDGHLVRLLGQRTTAHAAVAALARGGELGVATCDRCLEGTLPADHRRRVLCVRVCGMVAGPEGARVLRRHADHRERDTGLVAIQALGAIRAEAGEGVTGEWVPQLLDADLAHAARILQAVALLESVASASALRSALIDEHRLIRRRLLAGLALRHGPEAMDRIAFQLAQRDTRVHALALEWLDVTLTGIERRVPEVLDPALTTAERSKALARNYPLDPTTVAALVRDLAEDPNRIWRRPWISACAVAAAVDLPDLDANQLEADSAGDPDIERVLAEASTGLGRRR